MSESFLDIDLSMPVSSSGQDNTDARCTIGTVPNIFEGEPNDHDGPYDGIETGCDQ